VDGLPAELIKYGPYEIIEVIQNDKEYLGAGNNAIRMVLRNTVPYS
jgi:hypothetical protein